MKLSKIGVLNVRRCKTIVLEFITKYIINKSHFCFSVGVIQFNMLALIPLFKLHDKKIQFLIINLLFISGFALIYWIWGTPDHFKILYTAPYMSGLDALYFSFITHSTLGYGDIVPISSSMRFITILQTITVICYLFLVSL